MVDYNMLAQNIPDGLSTPPAVGSGGTGLGNLMNNNLLWSYLSALGAGMNKSPAALAVNKLTQDNIGAQSKIKMQNAYLKQMAEALKGSGEGSKGSGFKMNPDGSATINVAADKFNNENDLASILPHLLAGGLPDGHSISAPQTQGIQEQPLPPVDQVTQPTPVPEGRSAFHGMDAQSRANLANLVGTLKPNSPDLNAIMEAMLNPQTSPLSISNADLAGLSSGDVSQALHDTLGVEQARQSALMNAGTLAHQQYEMNKTKADPEGLIYPISVPGIGQVTARQWKELPSNQKEYAAYVHSNPDNPVSYKEFQGFGKETRSQFLEYLMTHPAAMAAEKSLMASGAASISLGPAEKAEQTGIGHTVADVLSPEYMKKVKESFARDENYQFPGKATLDKLKEKYKVDDEKALEMHRYTKELTKYDADLKQAYRARGKEVIRKLDGWYVDGVKVRDML